RAVILTTTGLTMTALASQLLQNLPHITCKFARPTRIGRARVDIVTSSASPLAMQRGYREAEDYCLFRADHFGDAPAQRPPTVDNRAGSVRDDRAGRNMVYPHPDFLLAGRNADTSRVAPPQQNRDVGFHRAVRPWPSGVGSPNHQWAAARIEHHRG